MTYYLEQYPNVKVPQFGWPRNKVSGVIGVHTTESGVFPAGYDPGAENTAGYLSRRDNHGSYHSLADWDSRIKLVRPRYAAWADVTNNRHAMSVSGAMNAARWRDLSPERAAGIVRNMAIAAAELVLDAIADGLLDSPPPARRITAQQAIDGTVPGFYGHGETNPGTRYDPGQHFDWDLFLATYAAAIGGTITYHSIQEDDMPSAQEIAQAVWSFQNKDLDHRDMRQIVADIPKDTVGRPVPYRDPITGGETGQTTSLGTLAAFSDFQHTSTRESLLAAVRGIVDAVKAAPGPDAAKAAEDAYAAFAEKLGSIKLTITAGDSK